MPFQLMKGDIVSMATDAIVYADTPQPLSRFAFNPLLLHKTGKEILKSREAINPLLIGSAKIAEASLLDCKYIIHTSPPAWHGGKYHELAQLKSCYEKVFQLAVEYGCKSIALPIIATDKLGFPKAVSQKMAMDCISEFLSTHTDVTVTLLVANHTVIMLPGNQYTQVDKLFDKTFGIPKRGQTIVEEEETLPEEKDPSWPSQDFADKLSYWMTAKEISQEELCFRANLSPETLSVLLDGNAPFPGKSTVTALAMALTLSRDEVAELIEIAGYSLTGKNKFNLIIQYCLDNGLYHFNDINMILFRFQQELLG